MVTSSIIKHLLSDKDSLSDYCNGDVVSLDDIKRRLFLLERAENKRIPDHYYRLNQAKSFEKMESLGEVIRQGLYRLAESHLELKENKIYVKQDKQNEWQELITYIPPLILQAAFLHIKRPITSNASRDISAYFYMYILPNARYTALPYPFIPQLENYIKEKNGLHDLHMHLNGSTETDLAWQDFLFEPDQVYFDLKDGLGNQKVKEQFEQESDLRSPLEFRNLLLCARSIRVYLFKMLYSHSNEKNKKFNSSKHLLNAILEIKEQITSEDNPFVYNSASNPFAELISNDCCRPKHAMAIEGLMYVLIFRYIATNPRESVASLFHFYLLILGLSNRLLVQQLHQFGFEQFKKLTVNELRSNSERAYRNRFFQLHGNEQRNILFLEGRFSPKITRDGNMKLINSINDGWKSLLDEIDNELSLPKEKSPQLKLIAHFIKVADEEHNADKEIRHKALRYEVCTKAKVLALMKKNQSSYMKNVVAIDAASSEFDAPPEVFAPSYRYLRRNGFKHFTYHAGEDFFHIISGLRAIYEAVEFNGLSCGDRIGHATATGVSPALWIQNIGEAMFISQGEYLDNLLFSYHLIIEQDIESLKGSIPFIANRIQELNHQIYNKSYSLQTMEDAWLMRRFCPILLFSSSKDDAKLLPVFDNDEWCDIANKVTDKEKDERIELIKKYHCKNFRDEYNKIIEINVRQYFDTPDLEILQLEILKFLHKKEIVIETLPTSNVRIGYHHNFDTYHLWNWMKWEKKGFSIPPIVVGTDDTGIFATNIYNEYANIYCHLTCQCKMSHNAAMDVVEKLDKNGRIYRFE